MGRLILTIFTVLICIHATAQDTALRKPVHTITGNFSSFTTDNVGNLYVVINNTQLKKLAANGDSVASYNDVKRYGRITSIDAGNPFRILVYYKESSTIVILDRFLTARNVIDLRKSNIQQAATVALSYDNNTWVYDELNGRIKKIDDNGKLLMESVDLRGVFGVAPSFQVIFDENKSLYLYDPKLGWYVFDYYGALSKKYPFTNWKDVQVIGGKMIGRSDTAFVMVRPGELLEKAIRLPVSLSGSLKILYVNGHWYVLFPGKIEIYDAP